MNTGLHKQSHSYNQCMLEDTGRDRPKAIHKLRKMDNNSTNGSKMVEKSIIKSTFPNHICTSICWTTNNRPFCLSIIHHKPVSHPWNNTTGITMSMWWLTMGCIHLSNRSLLSTVWYSLALLLNFCFVQLSTDFKELVVNFYCCF